MFLSGGAGVDPFEGSAADDVAGVDIGISPSAGAVGADDPAAGCTGTDAGTGTAEVAVGDGCVESVRVPFGITMTGTGACGRDALDADAAIAQIVQNTPVVTDMIGRIGFSITFVWQIRAEALRSR